ncbi:hypothetical protein [Polaribacter sp. IC073]|uniref:hypothetical protein n=1 Tax=Polaribacter sp. IC073 TaxID=2508540 RepID=UPI0011BFAD41|nr:hypothetical protein [Polaribacter sp. IC073]TXD49201.1 hypothetical protein ES045_03805 [Polaribacter sp. IC073]
MNLLKNSLKKEYLKNLNKKEKEELFIANGILTRSEHNNKTYISNKILDEIYETFCYDHLNTVKAEDYPIRKLKIDLQITIDNLEKEKLIKKKFKKNKKILHKCELTFGYLSSPEDLKEMLYDSFEEYFKDQISEEVIEDYITSELTYTYYETTYPFNDLIKIEKAMMALEFLQSQITNATHNKNGKNNVLTIPEKIVFLDKIREIEVDTWDELDYKKRAKIISLLTGNNEQFLRKSISKLNRSFEENKKYVDQMDSLIKSLMV